MHPQGEFLFVPLLLITLLALVVPVLATRMRVIRLPIVVGEILAGILIGRSGLDMVHPSPTLKFLADFGFTFLMFLSGLEVSFETLRAPYRSIERRPKWQRPVELGILYFLLTCGIAVIIGFGLVRAGLAREPILMGLILSTTSLGIVVPILKERDETSTIYGQTILVSALISDFVTLLLLSIAIAAISKGLRLDLFLFLLLLGFFVVAAKFGRWVGKLPFLTGIFSELSHATAQIRVRGSFALMVIWVVLAETMGIEIILGAFLAGAIVSASGEGHESPLRAKLDAIGYGFFIPIFFITVGAEFDLRTLMASRTALLLVPVLIAAAYLVKILPALIFRTRFSWKETIAAGFLLSSRLSLIIAVSGIALDLQLISPATNSAIILVAIVTCTVSPLLFARILPPQIRNKREGIIILGAGQLSTLLGLRLRDGGEKVSFVDRDATALERIGKHGLSGVIGDAEDTRALEQAGARNARALITLLRSPEAVLGACRLAREIYQIPSIIARVDDPQLGTQLQGIGVSVVQPAMAVALAIEGALRFPAAFNVLMDKGDNLDLLDVPLENAELDGKPLRRFRLPGDALILGLQRQGEALVPHGNTVLRHGDILMLVGSPDSLREAKRWLAPDQG